MTERTERKPHVLTEPIATHPIEMSPYVYLTHSADDPECQITHRWERINPTECSCGKRIRYAYSIANYAWTVAHGEPREGVEVLFVEIAPVEVSGTTPDYIDLDLTQAIAPCSCCGRVQDWCECAVNQLVGVP